MIHTCQSRDMTPDWTVKGPFAGAYIGSVWNHPYAMGSPMTASGPPLSVGSGKRGV